MLLKSRRLATASMPRSDRRILPRRSIWNIAPVSATWARVPFCRMTKLLFNRQTYCFEHVTLLLNNAMRRSYLSNLTWPQVMHEHLSSGAGAAGAIWARAAKNKPDAHRRPRAAASQSGARFAIHQEHLLPSQTCHKTERSATPRQQCMWSPRPLALHARERCAARQRISSVAIVLYVKG